jgi:hypothetical protein
MHALKSELSHLMSASADDAFDAAKSRSEALVEQIKDTLNEIGDTLSAEEEHVEKADRGAAGCDAGIRLRARRRHWFHAEEALT